MTKENTRKIIESISVWKTNGLTRLTLVTTDGIGKVQIDLCHRDDSRFGRTAFIWDLYVQEKYRRQGIAKLLMNHAIKRAKNFGFTSATLEWELGNTPREIAWWYASLGFKEKEFSNNYALMVKQL